MILSDRDIRRGVEGGTIRIDPWDEVQLNPASYDVTLGDRVLLYSTHHLDAREDNPVRPFHVGADGMTLRPGVGYLMHTRERIWTEQYVPVLDGKSSVGRLFLQIHVTAGFGDPGFDGQYTLEVIAHHPVRIYPGMRIGQIRFHVLSSPCGKPYAGNYQGKHSTGPVPSRSFRQFKREG